MSDGPDDEDETEESPFTSIDFGPREFQGTKAYADLSDALDQDDDQHLRAAIIATFIENEHSVPIKEWIRWSEDFFNYVKEGRVTPPKLEVHTGSKKTVATDT